MGKITISRLGKGLLAVAAIVAIGVTVRCLVRAIQEETHTVRLSVGEELYGRSEIMQTLNDEAAKRHLKLIVSIGSRGEESVQQVASGEVDAAIVFGGLGIENPNVHQVACLRGEPLQLFVKAEIAGAGMAGLLGKRVNVGPKDGETQITVRRVIQHMGVAAGIDFQEEHHPLRELLAMPSDRLPDAIFVSAPLPSAAGRALVQKHNYRLVEIPFGEVLALQNPVICNLTIPANTYGYHPAVPDRKIHTVGSHTMVIARKDVPAKAVYRLLELLCESEFPRRIGKAPLDHATLQSVRDFPLHEGTVSYLTRNDPWMNQQVVDQLSEGSNFLISAASSLLLLWGWLRRRKPRDYSEFVRRATTLEIDACQAVRDGQFDRRQQMVVLDSLLQLKIDALEQHRNGTLPGDQTLADFLARMKQIHDSLASLPVNRPRAVATETETAANAA